MNFNGILFGKIGCGKTSIINTLNCNFNLETDKDHTPLDNGKAFKDYVNNSPVNPDFNSLYFRDTDGITTESYNYAEICDDWISNKTDDIHKDDIVFYGIDTSAPWVNTYREHINNIKKCVDTANQNNKSIAFYVLLNKADRISQKKLKQNLTYLQDIDVNIITLSCNDTFLNLVKKLQVDVPLQNTDYTEAR